MNPIRRVQFLKASCMSRLTKILLLAAIINTVAAALFLTGLVHVSRVPGLYVTFPLAAIFLGLAALARIFQKEFAAYDAEQRALRQRREPGGRSEPAPAAPSREPHAPAGA
jgi:hypothetical protein